MQIRCPQCHKMAKIEDPQAREWSCTDCGFLGASIDWSSRLGTGPPRASLNLGNDLSVNPENESSMNSCQAGRPTVHILNSEIERIISNAGATARFFRLAAYGTFIVGVVGTLVQVYSATHVSVGGVSSTVPNGSAAALSTFIFYFGATCLAAGMLMFCSLVIDLLRVSVIKREPT